MRVATGERNGKLVWCLARTEAAYAIQWTRSARKYLYELGGPIHLAAFLRDRFWRCAGLAPWWR